jgi:hypothetical protein
MSAEEHFSGFKKDIKSKFVTEEGIEEKRFEAEIVVQEVEDKRPLHMRLMERRIKHEDDMNEIYRLANRIRKLDEDEIIFYDQIKQEDEDKERMIKAKEREELEKFKSSAESIAKKVVYTQPVLNINPKKNSQKDMLMNAVLLKGKNGSGSVKKKTTAPTKPKKFEKILVASYESSDDD